MATATAAPPAGPIGRLKSLVENPLFERVIIGLIVLNAITLGLETSKSVMAEWGSVLLAIDKALLAVFVAELMAKMVVYGWRFWRDPWNLFDFSVVAIALLPATGNLAVLRALRILRALRLITAIPSVKRVVGSLLSAIPSMGSVIFLLLLITYVFAVMATKLFGEEFPELFGTLGASFFTFFQIMTLEGWSGDVVRPVMEKFPWAWAFFVPYIVVATFMVLNLFIGIVVDAMQQQSNDKAEAMADLLRPEGSPGSDHVLAELQSLRQELRLLKAGAELPPLDPSVAPTSPSARKGKRRGR